MTLRRSKLWCLFARICSIMETPGTLKTSSTWMAEKLFLSFPLDTVRSCQLQADKFVVRAVDPLTRTSSLFAPKASVASCSRLNFALAVLMAPGEISFTIRRTHIRSTLLFLNFTSLAGNHRLHSRTPMPLSMYYSGVKPLSARKDRLLIPRHQRDLRHLWSAARRMGRFFNLQAGQPVQCDAMPALCVSFNINRLPNVRKIGYSTKVVRHLAFCSSDASRSSLFTCGIFS